MKRVWKAGMEVPCSTSREEKVFVEVMQRARICLYCATMSDRCPDCVSSGEEGRRGAGREG